MKYFLLFISLAFFSCSPKIKTSVSEKHEKLEDTYKVIVFNSASELPSNFKKIGTTKIGDTGFTTNCDFYTVLEKAKIEARNTGANALLITEHLYPHDLGSTCHRINADLLRIEDSEYNKSIIAKDSVLSVNKFNTASNEVVSNNFGNTVASKPSGFLLAANIAQSFRVASSPDGLNSEQKEYLKKLKSGVSYDISAYYLKEGKTGFGLKYNVYKSSGTIDNQIITEDDGTEYNGSFTDDITISFIGPSFIMTEDERARVGEANLELALGYLSYQNKSTVFGSPVKITGSNLGVIGGMGYHFRITPHFLVGPQVNFVGGVLKKLKYKYEDGSTETIKLGDDDFENLWRIDLAISAKFRF
ncbi:hypothetical protein IR010_11205 [Flavobacterium sp. MR2016-29]|uniref:hypothetical protein n=1 Tax=Flavobacterium sp. MR2016-29 TaxID=2783795 RepID=UPI00188CE9F4|nr:hypothetical protein [Flavobacterium sp. MR2016-29]MBF4493110.1 hypothetical protein [Flavobacterium sp. MR2016-29]